MMTLLLPQRQQPMKIIAATVVAVMTISSVDAFAGLPSDPFSRNHHPIGITTSPSPTTRNSFSFRSSTTTRTCRQASRSTTTTTNDNDDWIPLTDNGSVQKQVVTPSSSSETHTTPSIGDTVIIRYQTWVGKANWTPAEVVTCWLQPQQGIEDRLATDFLSLEIDEAFLIDPQRFSESFVQTELGITAKIACKKLVLAAKRLATARQDYPATWFGSNNKDPHNHPPLDANDAYEFTLGKGKVIQGMEVGVASMIPGEVAQLQIRSDAAYGPEGYRKSNGDVLIPPFATLVFEIELLEKRF